MLSIGIRLHRKPRIHIKTSFTEITAVPDRDRNNETTFKVKTIKNFCIQFTPSIICLLAMQNQQHGSCLCGRPMPVTVLADTSAKTDNLRIDESFFFFPRVLLHVSTYQNDKKRMK
jgi:hypothetical protein